MTQDSLYQEQSAIYSDGSVHAITQDHHGFIWFGTLEGLNRYDGYSVITYPFEDHHPLSRLIKKITSIVEDSKGKLWIGTHGGGLSLFNQATESFEHFNKNRSEQNNLTSNNVNVIYEDSNGKLWIGTDNGLNIFNESQLNFVRFDDQANPTTSLGHSSITAIAEGNEGNLWIGSDNKGLYRLNLQSLSVTNFSNKTDDSNSLVSDNVTSLLFDDKRNLWIGSHYSGLSLLNTEKNTFIRHQHLDKDIYSISDDSIHTIFFASTGRVLVATNKGLNQWLPNSRRFTVYQKERIDSVNTSGDIVYSILQDKSELLWIGTNLGLYKWNVRYNDFEQVQSFSKDSANLNAYSLNRISANKRREGTFNNLTNQNKSESTIENENIFAIVENKQGDLWLGTLDGLALRNTKTGEIKRYFPTLESFNKKTKVTSIYLEDNNNILWAGTKNEGLIRLAMKTGEIKQFKNQPENNNSLSSNTVTFIKPASNNKLWIGTWGGGLNLFDPELQSFQHFLDKLSNNKVTSIYQDSNDLLWVGTFGGGINLLNQITKEVTIIKHQSNNPDSLSSNNILSIHKDRSGQLWFGTHSGLNQLIVNNECIQCYQFKSYTTTNGLASNRIVGIQEDEQGNLWLSSIAGLTRFNPIDETLKNYSVSDGIFGSEFNLGSFYKNRDGKMFFGGVHGITSFYPDDLKVNSYIPQVKLTQLLVNNQPISGDKVSGVTKPIADIKSIQLNYLDYLVTFKFASLDYHSPRKNRYRHQLVGFDKEWIETDKRRIASYTNLPQGEYTFKVMASNNEGVWNKEGVEIMVSITPPPWFSWWAYCLYVFLLISGIYVYVYTRTRRYRRQAEKLGQLVTERTQTIEELLENKNRLFTNISHEFRTPLSLILGPVQSILDKGLLSQQNNLQLSLIQRNANRLLRLVEQLLDVAKFDIIQSEDKSVQALDKILQQVTDEFKNAAVRSGIELKINRLEPVLSLLVDDAFEKIAINLISNAIKYSSSGDSISIELFQLDKNMIQFMVKDTGKGIAEDQQQIIYERFSRVLDEQSEKVPGAGIGLALVKELVTAHNGSIALTSQLGKGSCFTIFLPAHSQAKLEVFPRVIESDESIHQDSESVEEFALEKQASQSYNHEEIMDDNSSSKTTILIIEDNPDMQSYIESVLQPEYQCLIASNGKQGVSLALKHIPDLIISDVMMPEMDGFEVSQLIKTNLITSHIPLILLTALGDKKSRLRGWKEFADEYLTKPFSQDELLVRIASLLSIRKILRQQFKRKYVTSNIISTESHSTQDKSTVKLSDNNTKDEIENVIETNFILHLEKEVSKLYQQPKLKIDEIAKKLAMSDRQLNRKIKSILDVTPTEYLRAYRLRRSAELIKQGVDIANAGYSVGFTSHPYFSQCFKAFFGKSPTDFIK